MSGQGAQAVRGRTALDGATRVWLGRARGNHGPAVGGCKHGLAVAVHAVAAPMVFAAVAARHFKPAGAREPLPTALTRTLLVALFDPIVVAGAMMHSLEMFRSVPDTWLPFALIFASSWATGALLAMRPLPLAAKAPQR